MDVLTPTDFVVLANQTFEYAYPHLTVEGEIKNLSINRNRWVFFDIADDHSKVRCFGSVSSLSGPIDDGLLVRVVAHPRLHGQFGFSLNIQSLRPVGEGSIKRAADLLKQKLEKEGLFAKDRKRSIPYPPRSIGLVTSEESAAYKDFIKVLSNRMGGMEITLANVKVQGDLSSNEITRSIEWFNSHPSMIDVLVIIRGGGSKDDLQAFSAEQVVRGVASSRIPTLVAIGHESDVALAELAADVRASTPSNAAEILVPDRRNILEQLNSDIEYLYDTARESVSTMHRNIDMIIDDMHSTVSGLVDSQKELIDLKTRIINGFDPRAALARGYAIARCDNRIISSVKDVNHGDILNIELKDGDIKAEVRGDS